MHEAMNTLAESVCTAGLERLGKTGLEDGADGWSETDRRYGLS